MINKRTSECHVSQNAIFKRGEMGTVLRNHVCWHILYRDLNRQMQIITYFILLRRKFQTFVYLMKCGHPMLLHLVLILLLFFQLYKVLLTVAHEAVLNAIIQSSQNTINCHLSKLIKATTFPIICTLMLQNDTPLSTTFLTYLS